MAADSHISWTNKTWNPWTGCEKVSEGCARCYFFRDMNRFKQDPTLVEKSKTRFKAPLSWKEGEVIFTCSWSDFFIEQADQWRSEAWKIIKETPRHTYLILTKRYDRILDCLPADWNSVDYAHVWIGVSIESNKHAYRASYLKPEIIHNSFISFEPILSEIEWTTDFNNVRWVILGGESGYNTGKFKYRNCEIQWIEKLAIDAKANSKLVFVKQMGTAIAKRLDLASRHGSDINEWTFNKMLQLQEHPAIEKLKLEKSNATAKASD